MKNGQTLKKEIMAATGLKAKEISVRCERHGSYNIEVKKAFPLSKVEEIAKTRENVRYCEYSGEILSGGNTFVFVRHPYNMEVPAAIRETIEKAAGQFSWAAFQDKYARIHHVKNYIVENKLIEGFEKADDVGHIMLCLPHDELNVILGLNAHAA